MGIITRMLAKLVSQEKIDSLIKEVIESKINDVAMQEQIQLSIRVAAETGINALELEEAVASKYSLKQIAGAVADVIDTSDIAEKVSEKFNASEIANEIDTSDIAYEIGAEAVAENVNIQDVAGSIDLDELADKILSKKSDKIDLSKIDYEQLAIALMSTIKLLSTLKEKVNSK